VKRREFLAFLREQGCVFLREGKRHSWWGNPTANRRSAVPRHSEISKNMCRKICRDLGILHPWQRIEEEE
jgi:mRNA interferase HicA